MNWRPAIFKKSDKALISAANNGDTAATEKLYYRYKDWVFGVAFYYCKNSEDAAEVLQEVFFYFFRKFPGFELTCKLKTFLYPVIKNRSIDLIRKRKPDISIEGHINSLKAPKDRNIKQELKNLYEMTVELPVEQQEVVMLRFGDELSLKEIAKALNVPLGTVKSRLHNALKNLRK